MVLFTVNAHESDSFRELASDCSCPNYTLSYECTVVGVPGGITIWKGTAFDCPSRPYISLIHRMFPNESSNYQTVFQSCNSGAIKVWSVGVRNNTYISRLNVTLNVDIFGRSIGCSHDNGKGKSTKVGSSLITGILKLKLSDIFVFTYTVHVFLNYHKVNPSVRLSNSSQNQLTFNWSGSAISLNCPDIHYNIVTVNCGNCPTTTNHTSVICTDVPTSGVCTLSVLVVVCGSVVGNVSESLTIIPHNRVESESMLWPTLITVGVVLLIAIALIFVVVLILVILCKTLRMKGLLYQTPSNHSR